MNNVFLIGRLTFDPEFREAGGSRLASFTLAVNNSYKAKDGTRKEVTAFVRCTAWGLQAEWTERLKKGDLAVVTGSLESRSYTNKDDKKIEVLGVKVFAIDGISDRKSQGNDRSKPVLKEEAGTNDDFDDEIPF